MKIGNGFKKGQKVKYKVKHANGTSRGKGIITALIPKGAENGDCRLTVKDGKGVVRRLFASQISVA